MFIPESKLESFKAELAKLNKKLAKYNSSVEILLCMKGYMNLEYNDFFHYVDGTINKKSNIFFGKDTVTIEGYTIELSTPIANGKKDVKYLGNIKFTDGVMQVHSSNEESLFNRVNTNQKDVCDHCGKNMKRNNWYFFLEDGKVKKIGSTCVHEWFGMDIESILAKYEEFMIYVKSFSDEEEMENIKRQSSLFNITNIIQALSIVTKEFTLSWQKRSDYTLGTATEVEHMLFDDKAKMDCFDTEEVKQIVLDKWNIDATTEIEYNIVSALIDDGELAEMVHVKHLGVVCWAIWNAMTTIKKANNNISSEYLGEVGDKIEFTATPKCVFSEKGYYGITYIYIFETEKGIVKWTTSKAIDVEKESTFKGTIKETTKYNGQKQTVVTRCKEVK